MASCKFCDSNAQGEYSRVSREWEFSCPQCGHYIITAATLERDLPIVTTEEKSLFSAHIRNNSSSESPLLISNSDINDIPRIVAQYKKLSAIDKTNRIMRYFGKTSSSIGQQIKIDYINETPLFFCKTPVETSSLLKYLLEKGLLDGRFTSNDCTYWLTVEGWNAYENLNKIDSESKIAFVAMSFNEEHKAIMDDAITPACDSCGFFAHRVDKSEHNEKICDRIIADIKQSRFVIADFTAQKHGVYFEAGYALGLGLPVIWCCKESDKDNLHFDTRQYNHIIWKDLEDLQKKLINRIKATI